MPIVCYFLLTFIFICRFKIIHTTFWSKTSLTGGAIGELLSDRAQFSLSPFVYNLDRVGHLAPLVRVGLIKNIIIFRTPEDQGLFSSTLFRPFNMNIWYCVLVIIFVFGIYLVPVFKHENLYKNLKFNPTLLSNIMITHGQFCDQTSHFDPQSKSGRIAFLALMTCSFLLYNYYTSVLVGLFISSPPQSNIKDLFALSDSNLEIGIEDIPFTHAYFNSTRKKDVQYFYKKKVLGSKNQSALWMSQDDGLKRVRKGGFAYSAEISTFYKNIEKTFSPQDMFDLNELILRYDNNFVIFVSDKSPFKEILKIKLVFLFVICV